MSIVDPGFKHHHPPIERGGQQVRGDLAVDVSWNLPPLHSALDDGQRYATPFLLERPRRARQGGAAGELSVQIDQDPPYQGVSRIDVQLTHHVVDFRMAREKLDSSKIGLTITSMSVLMALMDPYDARHATDGAKPNRDVSSAIMRPCFVR